MDLVFRSGSWGSAQRTGRRIGRLAWRLSRRDRARSLDHLALAFPERSGEERTALAQASFEHYGTMLGEAFWLRHRGADDLAQVVELVGWERIEAARIAGRPILILTGHCGNWELLAAALNSRGLEMAVVARELDDPGLQEMLLTLRSRYGTRTIVRGTPGAARLLLSKLRTGGALGMLIDQDTRVDGVFVPFFGRPAYTPVGAAELALRFDAVVLPTFIERLADGTHRATIEPELRLPLDSTAATALMTEAIETQIRRVPEQWVWLHRRWRRQPVESPM
ncbi:MAG: lysophospholipid acyltransferase family protein [Thermoanaerobaculia bacterium]